MSAIATGSIPPTTLPIPPNFTREEAHRMYQKWQAMKAQGMNETHPDFAHVSAILRAMHSKQQQHQLRAQQNGVSQVNGRPAQVANAQHAQHQPNASASPKQRPPTSRQGDDIQLGSNSTQTQTAPTGPKPAATGSSFTLDQLSILKNQICAFKLISRNVPVPSHIQNAIFSSAPKSTSTSSAIASVNTALDSIVSEKAHGGDKADLDCRKPGTGYTTYTSPWERLLPNISYIDHGSREKRLMIPSIMPSGLDLAQLQEERERVIYNRIIARKTELENLPSNLTNLNTKSLADGLSDSLKIKALIEYKGLCLLQKQRALRQQVVDTMMHADNLNITTNRALYRRMKKQSLREAKITEKLEKAQRDQREKRERQKHQDYLQGVITHGRDIIASGTAQSSKCQKFGRMMLQHHQHMEKEEQKRMERTAKQRLQALKANDEEAYLKLLDQAKDTRITHLLKQTDQFLDSLAQAVRTQQKDAVQTYGRPEGYVDDSSDDEDDEKKVDYYTVAHRIQETVTEQPSILVGGKLKEYQVKGLQWMVSLYNNNLNGILADEMGLGKTIQTISLITFLIEKKRQNGPFLVIVPLSTLTNWNLEFEKWAPSVSKIVYKGPPLARKQQQQQIKYSNFQVLLTTYEYIIKDRPILSKIKWNYMIVDEGHRMKNSQSKLSSTLTTYYSCRFRLILTGTPLQNNLPELWALLNFVLPNIFKSVKSFDEWFNTPFANTGGQDKMELTEEESLLIIRRLHKVLRPFLLRRLKKDVEAELPDKKEEVIKCKLSALQAKLYSQLVNEGMLYVQDNEKGGRTNVKGLSNMIMQLRKVCNHPFVFEQVEMAINPSKVNNDYLWRTAGKFELLDRLLPKFFETKHRVLMFFQMTQIMNIMEDFLHLRGYRYLRLDGSTKADDRSLLLKLFNAPDSPYFIFLLSTRAGGLGLNLQTADTVIIYDSDWNPHQDLQAQDRAHRIGQKNEVRILRLITSNTVEEKILERAQYKLDIDGKVIQAGKFDNKSTNEERDALLRTLLEAGNNRDSGDDEEMDDEELNEVIARNEDELEFFRILDREREMDPVYGPGKLPRLFPESELPEIYLQDNFPSVEDDQSSLGRGARERAQVRYDDGLTEEQWLDAMEDEDDTPEDAARRKRERIERRQQNKLKRLALLTDSPPPSSPAAEVETPSMAKRKRGRQPKSKDTPRKEEVEEPKRKKARSKASHDMMSPDDRASYQRVFENVYDAAVNLQDPEDEHTYSEHFIHLPSKKFYPDYYQFIKTPISFEIIRKRIERELYGSLLEFKSDFLLMFANARHYNEPGSGIYNDAERMEEEFNLRIKEEVERNKDLLGGENYGSQLDGQSGSISGEATPMNVAVASNIRLKLSKHALASSSAQSPDDDSE